MRVVLVVELIPNVGHVLDGCRHRVGVVEVKREGDGLAQLDLRVIPTSFGF